MRRTEGPQQAFARVSLRPIRSIPPAPCSFLRGRPGPFAPTHLSQVGSRAYRPRSLSLEPGKLGEYNTEAIAIAPTARAAAAPARGTQTRCDAAPAPATQTAESPRRCTCRVLISCCYSLCSRIETISIITAVPVPAPFIYIPMHIIQTPGI